MAYFPNFTYEIIFASPKVNPATDNIIKDYFSILEKDFGDIQSVHFSYIANDAFKNDILIPTLKASQSDSDTSELFLRSVRMLEIFGIMNFNVNKNATVKRDKKTDAKSSISGQLKSMGMSAFINYYDYFKDQSRSVSDMVNIFRKDGYKLNSCRTKASVGKTL